MRRRPPYGVLGVFFVMLGAGVILDGDWTWRGTIVILLGAVLLALEGRMQ